MKDHTLSAVLDNSNSIQSLDINLKQHLYKVLDIIDSLYSLQRSNTGLIGLENYFYKEIIRLFNDCIEFLPIDSSFKLKDQIKSIENGIYDLASIELATSDKNTIYLILGKIFSSEQSKKYYSAVLGVEDKRFYKLIGKYKKDISNNSDKVSLIKESEIANFVNLNNTFKCMNVVKLSGYINEKHIPFSLFFSGGKKQELSSLSNTILFTNIYLQRFRIISESIGRELIDSNMLTEKSDYNIIEKVLVLWLWGHDIGHFLKEDNLKYNISEDNKYVYEVLHEVRSDIFSLYLLKQFCEDSLNIKKEIVYLVFVEEMFRYIRRGDFENQPDSVSAYLIFRSMLDNKALEIDLDSNKVVLNYATFDKLIDDLLILILDLFRNGLFENVGSLLSELKINYDFEELEKNIELDLSFNNIPSFINII